jgi:hypothetical protein
MLLFKVKIKKPFNRINGQNILKSPARRDEFVVQANIKTLLLAFRRTGRKQSGIRSKLYINSIVIMTERNVKWIFK